MARLNEEGREHLEAYWFHPDEDAQRSLKQRHSKMIGDERASLAPFAAAAHYGHATFKYLLHVDDDTIVHMQPLQALLEGLVPAAAWDTPLALSDNIWFKWQHPTLLAPRCLPCGFDTSAISGDALERSQAAARMAHQTHHPRGKATAGWLPHPGCPVCSPALACLGHNRTGLRCIPVGPRPGAHGGAGMILSTGLLRSIPLDQARASLAAIFQCSGSDCLIANILWARGVAYTDPGLTLLPGGEDDVLFDNRKCKELLKRAAALAAGAPCHVSPCEECDSRCAWYFRHAVSCHLSARMFKTYAEAADTMRHMVEGHRAMVARLGAGPGAGGRTGVGGGDG